MIQDSEGHDLQPGDEVWVRGRVTLTAPGSPLDLQVSFRVSLPWGASFEVPVMIRGGPGSATRKVL